MPEKGQAISNQELVTEPVELLEISIQTCLRKLCISLLSEWDVLAFLTNHMVLLADSKPIADLTGYESTVVDCALERLEHERLIECSSSPRGIRLYRARRSADPTQDNSLQQFAKLANNRAARILVTKQLNGNRSRIAT